MGWAVGSDKGRDVGYGVPAYCDHPGCNAEIDRGLGYVCGDEPGGGDNGCGLFFCVQHSVGYHQRCERCCAEQSPFDPKPDHPDWMRWKLTDESWKRWRDQNPAEVAKLKAALDDRAPDQGAVALKDGAA